MLLLIPVTGPATELRRGEIGGSRNEVAPDDDADEGEDMSRSV